MIDLPALKESAPSLLALAGQLTTLRKIAASAGGEWAGACPFCGGQDRFHIQPNHRPESRWLCRNCTDGKWKDVIDFVERRDGIDFIDAIKALFGPNAQVTPESVARLQEQRAAADAERARHEAEQMTAKRAEIDATRAWVEYHRHPDTYAHWGARGISPQWVDYFQAGYNPGREFWHDGKSFISPSLTIPTFHTHVIDGVPEWNCVALAHRLLVDNAPGGKYRPHLAGCGKPLFRCDLYDPEIRGEVLLVEGEIKAMVTWARLQDFVYQERPTNRMGRLSVVGCAGKGFTVAQAAEMKLASEIWICLDPDAPEQAAAAARMLGADRCRIVDLPGKIDDLLIEGSLDIFSLWTAMRVARRVK